MLFLLFSPTVPALNYLLFASHELVIAHQLCDKQVDAGIFYSSFLSPVGLSLYSIGSLFVLREIFLSLFFEARECLKEYKTQQKV